MAKRLADPNAVRRAKAFPYQIMASFDAMDGAVPAVVREALQDAMEVAVSAVPKVAGHVVICPDVSGSMGSPITGHRRGATTKVRCIDVAALVASAMLRANPSARVMPFEWNVVDIGLNPRDSVMTNAGKLAAIGGGGTNCSAPVERLVSQRAEVDLVLFISDNQSWVDRQSGRGTALIDAFARLKRRNPQARLVCIDLQPYGTTQTSEREDVLNIGGFSDAVFEIVASFAAGTLGPDHWVGEIEKIAL